MHPLTQYSSHAGTRFQLHSVIEGITDKRRAGWFADFHCDHDGIIAAKCTVLAFTYLARSNEADWKLHALKQFRISLDRLRLEEHNLLG